MTDTIVLDGGMGQELVKRTGKQNDPLWGVAVMLEKPEIVREIHKEYIEAGADVITLNTYSATPVRFRQKGLEDRFRPAQQLAVKLAHEARQEAGKPVRIAGCLPPLVGSYRADVAMGFDPSLEDYREIVAQQVDGVDLFICETMASIEEAKGAVTAAMETGKPVWLAWTLTDDASVTIRSGDPLSDALDAMLGSGIDATLINCSRPETISNAWPTLATTTGPIGAYANGFTSVDALQPGGAVEVLESRQDLDPAAYADFVDSWIENGASIVGGCCEVGPAHIAEIARRIRP